MAVTARQDHTQQVHYIRYNFAYNTASASAVQLSLGAAIPANAVVTRTFVSVPVAFNGTTGTIDVGTAAAPAALVSAQSVQSVSSAAVLPATLGGLLSATADLELFVRYNYTGTPTAGSGTVVVEYVPNV